MNVKKIAQFIGTVVGLTIVTLAIVVPTNRALDNGAWAKECDKRSAATGETVCSIPPPDPADAWNIYSHKKH